MRAKLPEELHGEPWIVKRVAAGDRAAFEELYGIAAPAVMRLLVRMLRDSSLAEEVLQETFVSVFRNMSRYRGEARLSTWVTRIAVKRALNARRDSSRLQKLHDAQAPAPGPSLADAGDRDLASKVLALMDRLDRPKRDALLLVAEGHTAAEIAFITGEPRGTVLARIHRARAELTQLSLSHGLLEDA